MSDKPTRLCSKNGHIVKVNMKPLLTEKLPVLIYLNHSQIVTIIVRLSMFELSGKPISVVGYPLL